MTSNTLVTLGLGAPPLLPTCGLAAPAGPARNLPTRALPDVTPLGPAAAARPRPIVTPL